jgi:hypothetical protein
VSNYIRRTSNPLTFGLALAGGIGLTLMMLALGIGVVLGDTADSSAVGSLFIIGITLLVIGVVGWVAVVQPYKNFDDINEPHFTGHHHDEHHDDHAIVVVDTPHIEPHAQNHP